VIIKDIVMHLGICRVCSENANNLLINF